MEKTVTNISALREGGYILIDNIACAIKTIQTSKTGKHGSSKSRIEAVGLINGVKKIIVKPGSDPIEVPIIEKKNAQVLSVNGNKATVMDTENYETFELIISEELKEEVSEGKNVVYWTIMDVKMIKQVK